MTVLEPETAIPQSHLEQKEGVVQATKHDGEKPRMALIPVRAKKEVAAVFTKGAVKYDVGNWHAGDSFDYDRLISAAERHIDDFSLGQRADHDSGRHVLAHAICELMMLLELDLAGHGIDNRTKAQYIPHGVESDAQDVEHA